MQEQDFGCCAAAAVEVRQDGVGHGSRGKQIKKTNSIVNMMYGGAGSLAFMELKT